MNKRPKEIDIFQRTLKCRDIPLEEEEIEIFEVESEEKIAEEEEIPTEPETEIDPEALYAELECVKRQLQKLLLLIKATFAPFEPELKPEKTPEAICEEEAAICALQKAQHKVQCQIYELTRCFKLIREELRQMHINFCVESKEVEQLWRLVAFLLYWQRALEPDVGVCHQRFTYLLQKKAEWSEIEALICKKKRCPELLFTRFLAHENLHTQRIYLQAELEKLKHIFVYIFEMKNPSYSSNDFDAPGEAFPRQPLKQIEFDYILREVKKNRALQSKDCKEYFKCDKIEW